MAHVEDKGERIEEIDITLFDPIPSQTNSEDRKSFLWLLKIARSKGEYCFLEIGSHLGGTLQVPFVDPFCKSIISIGKRPESQPDIRGRRSYYKDNSTDRMLRNLAEAYPEGHIEKVICFDCSAEDVDASGIVDPVHLCFIDGEHTIRAALSDFKYCLSVFRENSIIAFHDAGLVSDAIKKSREHLSSLGVAFESVMLGGNIFAILLGDASNEIQRLTPISQDEKEYMRRERCALRDERWESKKEWVKSRFPPLYDFYRVIKNACSKKLSRGEGE